MSPEHSITYYPPRASRAAPGGGGRPPIPAFTMWGHSYTNSPISNINGPGLSEQITHPWYPAGRIDHMLPWRIDRILASMLGIEEDKVRHFGVSGAFLLNDQQATYPLPGFGLNMSFTKRYGWAWILQQTSKAYFNRYGWLPQHSPQLQGLNFTDLRTHMDGQFSPFLGANTAHCLLYGANDLGYYGDPHKQVDNVNDMFLTAWAEVNRSIIARLRCGGVIEDDLLWDSAKQQYGVSYSGAWLRVPSTLYNSGTSTTAISGSAGSLTIHLGADWPGGVLSLRFRGEPNTGGTFTLPGGSPVSVAKRMPNTYTSNQRFNDQVVSSTATMNVPAWAPSYSTIVRRVAVPRSTTNPPQPQTVVVNVNGVPGPVCFDSCDLEQSGMAAPVAIANIPIPVRWLGAYANSPRWAAYPDTWSGTVATPTNPSGVTGANQDGQSRGAQVAEDGDTWALTLNTALANVVAEFAEIAADGTSMNSVQVADLYTACNGIKHPEYYLPEDILHPNAAGCAVMASEFYRALSAATARPLTAASLGAA